MRTLSNLVVLAFLIGGAAMIGICQWRDPHLAGELDLGQTLLHRPGDGRSRVVLD
jgi:hypothetical protein